MTGTRLASSCCCVTKEDDPGCENPFDLEECCATFKEYTVISPFDGSSITYTRPTFNITMTVGQYASDEFYATGGSIFTSYATYISGTVILGFGSEDYRGYSAGYPIPADQIDPTTGIPSINWQLWLQGGVNANSPADIDGNVYDDHRLYMQKNLASGMLNVDGSSSNRELGITPWSWIAEGYIGPGVNIDYCETCPKNNNSDPSVCFSERYICPSQREWRVFATRADAFHYGPPFGNCGAQRKHEQGCLSAFEYLVPQVQSSLGCCFSSYCSPCDPDPDQDYGTACTPNSAGHIRYGIFPPSGVGNPVYDGCQYVGSETACGEVQTPHSIVIT